MVYHSSFVDNDGAQLACGCPLLPVKISSKDQNADSEESTANDIIDEAILFFRANVLFRKFDIQSRADKLLVYLTFYINSALKKIDPSKSEPSCARTLSKFALEAFPIPGEPSFPIGGLFSAPKSPEESEKFRSYLREVREETSFRLAKKIVLPDGTVDKFWLAFGKRKFMNKMMTSC